MKNKEIKKEYDKKRYAKNRKKIIQQSLRYYKTHKKERSLYRKEKYKKNKKQFLEYSKKQYNKHKEKKSSYVKKRKSIDKGYAIRLRLRGLLSHALNRYTKTGKIWSASKYGINYKVIIEHLKPFPEDLSKYHIDHIKPLVSFNLENLEEIKKAFAPKNHQWLLVKENLSKNSKWEGSNEE